MHYDVPEIVQSFMTHIENTHSTRIEIREWLPTGKSGAFVAFADCSGSHDGIYVLKVDTFPVSREDEEARHKRALAEGAFHGRLSAIVLSEKTETHYCLLMKLAGESRIAWRPLINSLKLFRAAYTSFGRAAWTPELFKLGSQQHPANVIRDAVGYKLVDPDRGRIKKHIARFLGDAHLTRPAFVHHDQMLPNPYYFATMPSDQIPMLRPLLGPVHGDCHGNNIFVKARQDASIIDIALIDLATYESHSLVFLDHAYLELATLLKQMDRLGDRRWLEFVVALSREGDKSYLTPDERGWVEEVFASRIEFSKLAYKNYKDRMDDLRLQFIAAQVAAGLIFLHKEPKGSGSAGLTPAQYIQSFVWSGVFLRRYLELLHISTDKLCPPGGQIPLLGSVSPHGPTREQWASVKNFDAKGFNVLVVPPSQGALPRGLIGLPWTLIIDFRVDPPAEDELRGTDRLFRQGWPGGAAYDTRLLTRGGLWYFANGRKDVSEAEPTLTPDDWRRRYRRALEDLLVRISETQAPGDVRVLLLSEGFSASHTRLIYESIDSAFHSALAPIVLASSHADHSLDSVNVITTTIDAAVSVLTSARDPVGDAGETTAMLPWRRGADFALKPVPPDLLVRINRDLTVVYRGRAQTFPPDRTFGIDFRRGLPIEWAELAQNLDVPRPVAFERLSKAVEEGLKASSNITVNLLHEPSSGGTTLSRRVAWHFMERNPVVLIEQLSSDSAAYLRDVFRFSSLPLLVIMEATTVTESEREALLRELREDNTRAVFLWIARTYGARDEKEVLQGRLDDTEAALFKDAYLDQSMDEGRRSALERLATVPALRSQRSPFFFGLTAFGEKFYGVDQLIKEVMTSLQQPIERELVSDLALTSLYSSEGFPLTEFNELCKRLNLGKWPLDPDSLFLLVSSSAVKVSHAILAERALASLARSTQWKADLPRFSSGLLERLSTLQHAISDRVQSLVQTLFITRDIESALQADTEVRAGGVASQRRFSPLIIDLGSAQLARSILRRVVQRWPRELHYAAHLARHLMYEDPREIEEAIKVAEKASNTEAGSKDSSLIHVTGMSYRVRMEERLLGARNGAEPLSTVEEQVQFDFDQAVDNFSRANETNPADEHGHVAIIQAVRNLLRYVLEITKSKDLAEFLRPAERRWYLNTVALAEDHVEQLLSRPHLSKRARGTTAEWDLVYGRVDKVITELRLLATKYEDVPIRRALCAAIVARAKHKWATIPQADLKTIAQMMERNLDQQGVRDSDIRKWFSAYRRLRAYDIDFAIERLIVWHKLNHKSVDPVYYLYVLHFLRWLSASQSVERRGVAKEVNAWLVLCRANRALGERSFSFEWLERAGNTFDIANFADLDYNPSEVIRTVDHPARKKLNSQLLRVEGTVRNFRGPQFAELDLGNDLMVRITPLERLTADDVGKRASAFISFSYDGVVGWDPMLNPPK